MSTLFELLRELQNVPIEPVFEAAAQDWFPLVDDDYTMMSRIFERDYPEYDEADVHDVTIEYLEEEAALLSLRTPTIIMPLDGTE